jgi:hypothetical protein
LWVDIDYKLGGGGGQYQMWVLETQMPLFCIWYHTGLGGGAHLLPPAIPPKVMLMGQ